MSTEAPVAKVAAPGFASFRMPTTWIHPVNLELQLVLKRVSGHDMWQRITWNFAKNGLAQLLQSHRSQDFGAWRRNIYSCRPEKCVGIGRREMETEAVLHGV